MAALSVACCATGLMTHLIEKRAEASEKPKGVGHVHIGGEDGDPTALGAECRYAGHDIRLDFLYSRK